MDRISLRVQGPSSPIAVQIWRPLGEGEEGKYHLHWYSTFAKDMSVMTRRDELVYQDPTGVPVKEGDVLGFFIPSSSEESISVTYYQHQDSAGDAASAASAAALFYMESVGDSPLCDVVLCDASGKTVAGAVPFIQTHCKFSLWQGWSYG